ncbi:unnamed protein product, partial [Polarella glacialis]
GRRWAMWSIPRRKQASECSRGIMPRRARPIFYVLCLAFTLRLRSAGVFDQVFTSGAALAGKRTLSSFSGFSQTGCSRMPCAAGEDDYDLADELAEMARIKSRRGVTAAAAKTPSPAPAPARAAQAGAGGLFKPGQELEGTVKTVKDIGLVIQLPKTTGFVHVSEVREGYTEHAGEIAEAGDKVKVWVLKHEPGFLSLTMKEAGSKTVGSFLIGEQVEGIVKACTELGAFLNIGATKDAWLFRGDIKAVVDGGNSIRDAREYLQVGDKIKAWIKKKDVAKNTLAVTLVQGQQAVMPMQAGLKLADLKVGQEMGGSVSGVRDFGCFVKIGAEKDGLLHVRNINDGLVSNIRSLMKIGDPVVVRVKGFNDGKLELELVSTPSRLPAVDTFTQLKEDEWMEGYVSGKAPFGIFVDVESPDVGALVTGLLGVSHLDLKHKPERINAPPRMDENGEMVDPQEDKKSKAAPKVKFEPLAVGDAVKVRVLSVNVERRQLFLTQNEFKRELDSST